MLQKGAKEAIDIQSRISVVDGKKMLDGKYFVQDSDEESDEKQQFSDDDANDDYYDEEEPMDEEKEKSIIR